MASKEKKKKTRQHGPIRDNLEAIGVAIVAAVLLKPFVIEAYQIPTSSMQPTLMGSVEAAVYDRILVDKWRYTFTDPKRWDITVFRYPLQQNQNYVKRCVGMPNDRLRVAGGNIYQVSTDEDGNETLKVERKPDHVQANLWKEVYPLRRLVKSQTRILRDYFVGSPTRKWREDGEDLLVDLGATDTGSLSFAGGDTSDGGIVNRVYDGYSVAVAEKMREVHYFPLSDPRGKAEAVPDVRIAADLTPTSAMKSLTLEIEVRRPGRDKLTYRLALEGSQARLEVTQGDRQEQSDPFPLEAPGGDTTRVSFAHLDDRLIAWRDGEELADMDVSEFRPLTGLEWHLTSSPQDLGVTPRIRIKGGGETRFANLEIHRDLHYVRSSLPPDHVIAVPEGHYFMMGDNTLQSVDSRDWTAITVGVLPDGTLVPPDTEGARKIRGNMRPVMPSEPPDRDETPIVFPKQDVVVMIDEFGEIHRFKSGISPAYGQPREGFSNIILFTPPDAEDGDGTRDWSPPDEKVRFVPREHILGRALMAFWPFWPFGEQRLGTIR